MNELGIIYGEPDEAYHASDAVGSHKLQDLSPYPLLFFKKYVEKSIPPDSETPALAFGKFFHMLAVEGEDVAARHYAITPDADRRTNVGKKIWSDWFATNEGKRQVAQWDHDLAWRMVKAIREKPSAVALLSRGKPEVTFRHKLASFAIQARVDWFDGAEKDAPMIVDVKTIDSLAEFDRQFFKFSYYKQAAFYRLVVASLLGLQTFQPQFCYLVVEKAEPFQVAIRTPDAESLAIGTTEVMRDLSKLKACYDSGVWPGEPDVARPVSLPEWKTREAAS